MSTITPITFNELSDALRTAIDVHGIAGTVHGIGTAATMKPILEVIYQKDLMAIRTATQARQVWEELREENEAFLLYMDIVNAFTLRLSFRAGALLSFLEAVAKTSENLAPGSTNETVDEVFRESMRNERVGTAWMMDHPWFAVMLFWRHAIPLHTFNFAA